MKIKKLVSKLALMLAMVMIFVAANPLTARAADKTYTVTFRPGDVGQFDLATVVNANQFGSYPCTTTSQGAIKVTVPSGALISFPVDVMADEGYFPRGWTDGNDAVSGTSFNVTKNQEFVADYGVIVEGIEYEVRYVIKGTDTSVRPIYVTRGNADLKVEQVAPKVIEVSEGAFYLLIGDEKQTITLEKDKDNVITFEYVLQDRKYNESVDTVYTEGETVTTVENVVGAAPQAVAPGGNGGAAPMAVAPAEVAENPETIEITEPDTALAAGLEGDDLTNIEIPETAKDAGLDQATNLPYALLGLVIVAVIATVYFIYNKRRVK